MIYSSTDILDAFSTGEIEIIPYSPAQLGANSYDVRLGNVFYEVCWNENGPFFMGPVYYEDGQKVRIPIGGTLLGMTEERILINGPIVPELRTRSTIRRIGIDVCMAAGFGDIGYSDHWTIELTAFVGNGLPYLVVGERVAQIVFNQARSMPATKYQGQYRSNWPENMVPRQYRNRIIERKLCQKQDQS